MTFDSYIQANKIAPSDAAKDLEITLSMVSKLRSQKHSKPSLALATRIYEWSGKQVNLLETAA